VPEAGVGIVQNRHGRFVFAREITEIDGEQNNGCNGG
jgi:hypothetical protein